MMKISLRNEKNENETATFCETITTTKLNRRKERKSTMQRTNETSEKN